MSSDAVPRGHEEVLAGLWRSAGAGRLPHALLFEGPEGTGKHLAARHLAQGLFCASGPGAPCGGCGPCKRFRSGNHPDFFDLDVVTLVDEEQITVNWIRPRADDPKPRVQTIERFLGLKPAEGGWRAVVVREAERLNASSQNALLKTLEEPRPYTLIVLETARPARLFETVRSRLVRVAFAPLPPELAAEVLATHGIEGAEARELARWSRGAPGRALALRAGGGPAVRRLLLEVLRGERPPLAASAAVWELDGEFAGRTPRAEARERARFVLELGIELLADARRAAAGVDPVDLAHGDALDPPLPERAAEALEEWLAARQDVEANLAPEGILDRAFLAFARTRAAGAATTRRA